MLLRKHNSIGRRILNVLAATAAITLGGLALGLLGGVMKVWDWPPKPSSAFGVILGVVGGAIILFEMAIWPKKMFRGVRLGSTRSWMWWHIWLGLVCFPVIILHSGFGFGGPLSAWTFGLFIAVIASGVWGLIVQQWLPSKILAEIPDETVASQVDRAILTHWEEARRLVEDLVTVPPEDERAAAGIGAQMNRAGGGGRVIIDTTHRAEPIVVGKPAAELIRFKDQLLLPYLRKGQRSRSPLKSRSEAERQFTRLRDTLPEEAREALLRLEELADLRRQWDGLVRLNFWLHNWLLLHLPLSVGMTGLMVVHAIRALKYW